MRQGILRRIRSQAGTSLLEVMITVAIGVTVSSVGIAQYTSVRRAMAGDGAMRVVMGQLNRAQQLATQQRRNIEVQFVGGNWIKLVRHELDGTTTALGAVALEGSMQYATISGVPDTPDNFGNGSAVAFPVGAGNATQEVFTSDGLLVDQNGNPLNGTIFLSVAGQVTSLRAVTVMGNTGRVRAYRGVASKTGAFVGWTRV